MPFTVVKVEATAKDEKLNSEELQNPFAFQLSWEGGLAFRKL